MPKDLSEGFYRLLVEEVTDYAIFLLDVDGRVSSWNRGAERILGYREEEIVGQPGAVIFTPEDVERGEPERELKTAAAEGRAADERWHVRRDGSRFWASGAVTALRDEGGRLRGFAKVMRDFTERKRMEDALRVSEGRFRAMFEQAPFSIQLLSPDGRTSQVNRAWEELWGVTIEQVADYNMLHDEQLAAKGVMPYIERGFAGEAAAIPAILYDPNETIPDRTSHREPGRWVRAYIYPLKDGEGRVSEVVLMHEDITERKQAEEERARLLRREQEARARAEEASRLHRGAEERLTLLVEASDTILGSAELSGVQAAILRLSQRLIAADAYAVWRQNPQTGRWAIVAATGLSEAYQRGVIEADERTPPLPEGPIVVEDVRRLPLLSGRQEFYREEGIESLLAVPLKLSGHTSGTVTFYYRRPRSFGEAEVRVAQALGNLAGSALQAAELLEEQSRLRRGAEESERRAAFIAEASTLLASSLDYETTLRSVARLAVPRFADWCVVDMLEGGGIRRVAVVHSDPAKVEWAEEFRRHYPPDPNDERGVAGVLRTMRPELYPDITDALLVGAAVDEEHLRMLREAGIKSVMIVPMASRGRALGAVTFVTAESGRRYGPEELAAAEDLARRAAVAVDNAQLYRATEEALREAREASRLKDEFLAVVSHELRTPLNAMLGWAGLLRGGKLPPDRFARAVETIERNARAQAQIVEDILDVSRIITGRLRLDIREANLAQVIEAAVEAVRPGAEAKGVGLRVSLDAEAGPVRGDPARLQQVVWNLVSNAVKFTPKGGRVEVRLGRAGSQAEVVVSDTGEGIRPEFLPHVFDRFRQADASSTRRHGGLGLGLSIVRHLVEMHGGTVEADSPGEGMGTTLTVRLPVAAVLRGAEGGEGLARAAAGDRRRADDMPSLRGLSLLVVDDEPDTREILAALLQGCGAAVRTAASVREALAEIEQRRPDVIISDIGMPEEDGYELIRRVRALGAEGGATIPAVALTAYARAEDRVRALREGFDLHAPKPVEPAELAIAVERLAKMRGLL